MWWYLYFPPSFCLYPLFRLFTLRVFVFFVCIFFAPRLDGGAVVQALQLTSSAVDLPPSVHMDTRLEIIIRYIKIPTKTNQSIDP